MWVAVLSRTAGCAYLRPTSSQAAVKAGAYISVSEGVWLFSSCSDPRMSACDKPRCSYFACFYLLLHVQRPGSSWSGCAGSVWRPLHCTPVTSAGGAAGVLEFSWLAQGSTTKGDAVWHRHCFSQALRRGRSHACPVVLLCICWLCVCVQGQAGNLVAAERAQPCYSLSHV